jgi:DNA-directed RNA polymerase specialized sigma subunit
MPLQGEFQQIGQSALAEIAAALDMTPQELMQAWRSGQSLAQIAEAQGVEREDLKTDLVRIYQEAADQVQKTVADNADSLAEQTLDFTPPARSPNGMNRPGMMAPGSGAQLALGREIWDDLPEIIGIDEDDFNAGLRSGKTVSQIAQEVGKDLNKVRADLEAELTQEIQEAESEGDITTQQAELARGQIPQIIERILTQAPPRR